MLLKNLLKAGLKEWIHDELDVFKPKIHKVFRKTGVVVFHPWCCRQYLPSLVVEVRCFSQPGKANLIGFVVGNYTAWCFERCLSLIILIYIINIYIDIYIPRTSKTSEMVVPFWEYRLLGTFYQNNGSPVKTKTLLVSNKASFCVCTCLAKPVRSYIHLLSLLPQPLTIMKWKSKIKTNK